MLVVEGTDLLGKTTLCNKLVKRLNDEYRALFTYQHLGRLPAHWHSVWSYVDKMTRYCVQDRFHDSELAYAQARGDRPIIDNDAYRLVEAHLALRAGLKVAIVCDDESLLRRRHRELGDDMYGIDVIERANAWFLNNQRRFEHVIHVNEDSEWAQKEDEDRILELYIARQDSLTLINMHIDKLGRSMWKQS